MFGNTINILLISSKNMVPQKMAMSYSLEPMSTLTMGFMSVYNTWHKIPLVKQVSNPSMVVHTFNLGHTFCWRPT